MTMLYTEILFYSESYNISLVPRHFVSSKYMSIHIYIYFFSVHVSNKVLVAQYVYYCSVMCIGRAISVDGESRKSSIARQRSTDV
jgi:hypothetical protein